MGKTKLQVGKAGNSDSLRIIKRERKKKRMLKSARIIVRNLPFKCNEDDVNGHFSKYGKILEVTILKKNDKPIGCGFVQFEKKNDAAKAIIRTSGKEFNGRPIIVDWAVSKDKFESIKGLDKRGAGEDVQIKDEIITDEETEKKETSLLDTSLAKSEEENESENDSGLDAPRDSDSDEEDDSDYDQMDEKQHSPQEYKLKIKQEPVEKPLKPRMTIADDSHSVFVKNIPFSATNEDLEKCGEVHGQINYALICVDPLTEHSKGTGFIQFKDANLAQKILDGEIELSIKGVPLLAFKPMKKEEIENAGSGKIKGPKDKRNLYLVKEGVILAGTPAAEGVSNGDMIKRLQLDGWKTKSLKNLHMFVSPTRLVIHNIPPFYDNAKLKLLFKKHAPKGAVIREARVMNDLRDVQPSGAPKSKGFGFVSFTKHGDALEALRRINNNPSIFIPNKRPIVAFSIENKKALQVKERRQQMSKNALAKGKEGSTDGANKPENVKPSKNPKAQLKSRKPPNNSENSVEKPSFAGVTARLGRQKMRSKRELINQQQQHFKDTKKWKHNKRISRKQKRMRKKSTQVNQPAR